MNAIDMGAPERMSRKVAIALMVGGIATLAITVGAWMKMTNASEPARTAITELQQLADRVDTADANGDRAAVLQVMDPLAALLRRLNDTPGIEATALQNCRIAAAHLAQGATEVYSGGRWADKSQYKAALADCS
jgi:hypothetical protein